MQDAKCGCGILSDVEWLDAILDCVMRNDGWNAVWDVWCGLECVLWDSVMCNLHLNLVMCMVWCEVECGMMWNGVPRCGGVISCELL